MQKKFVILFALLVVSLSLSACGNTFEGVGRDLENWGQTMQETF